MLTLAGKSIFKVFPILILLLLMMLNSPLYSATELKVKKIIFTGIHAFSQKELKDILKSKEKGRFNSRYLKLDQILITNYYTQHGYLDVYVSGTFDREGNDITLRYDILEGKRYYFKEMRFLGNELYSSQQLRDYFKIKEGEPYIKSVIETGLNAIEDLYANNGKPYAVFSEKMEVKSDSLISLKIYIQEGETVYIEDIEYEGLELVKGFIIRRELEIKKGEVYSRRKIERSQRNIYSTGLFKFVNFRLSPINDDESRVKLIWRFVEKKALWVGLRFGVGYEQGDAVGNVTTFDATAEAGNRNLFGTARSASFKVIGSLYYGKKDPSDSRNQFLNPRDQYSFTFVEPWILNTRTPGIFNITYSRQRQPVSVVPLSIFSTSFNISHKFESPWAYTAGISLQRVNLQETSGIDINTILQRVSQGQDLIYALTFNPVKDHRDNVLVPLYGYLTEIRNRFVYADSRIVQYSGMERSDTTVTNTLYKLFIQWSRYQPFTFQKKWTFATRLRASGMIEFGKQKPIEYIPTTERYYLGGASTIRGYGEQSIGRQVLVYNQNGSLQETIPVGGKYVLLGNAELRIPLFWLFIAEVFVDAGNLWEELEDIKSFSLKVSSGVGLAVVTPLGPIRFDYGLKWFPKKGERPGEFHVGISFAF